MFPKFQLTNYLKITLPLATGAKAEIVLALSNRLEKFQQQMRLFLCFLTTDGSTILDSTVEC